MASRMHSWCSVSKIGTVTICNMFVRIEFMLKSDAVDSQTAETQKRRNTSIQQALTAWVPFPRNRFCLGGIPPGWAVSSKFQQLIGQLHVWWRTPPGDGQGELRGAELLLEGWQRVMPGAGETIDGLPPYMGQLQTCSVFWGVRIKKNPGLHPSFQDATIFPPVIHCNKDGQALAWHGSPTAMTLVFSLQSLLTSNIRTVFKSCASST